MAKNPAKKTALTKKHLARIERERRQVRYIMIGSALVIVLVIATILYGVLYEQYLKPRQPIITVNGEGVSSLDFQGRVRYNRSTLIKQADQTLQIMQLFGSQPGMASQFSGQLTQIQSQFESATIGKSTLDMLTDDLLIRQEAKQKGITVSAEEINNAFQDAFGYYPKGSPTPTSTGKPLTTSTLSPLQLTLEPYTATPTFTVSAPTPIPTLEFTPTPTGVYTPTPTSAPTASPTPYTLQGYQKLYKDTMDNYKKQFNVTESDLRSVIISQLYRDKVEKEVVGEIPNTEEEVWARHILVADQKNAQHVLDLLKQGQDWSKLASQYSTDTSNKDKSGDLGWFGKGKMVGEFEKAAFALKVGETVTQPVKTQFGYHIIQVLGHEDRPITGNQVDQLRQTKFSDWLTAQKDKSKIVTKNDWLTMVPADPALPAAVQQAISNLQSAQPNAPVQVPPVITPNPPPAPTP